jgi:hypothetical protein
VTIDFNNNKLEINFIDNGTGITDKDLVFIKNQLEKVTVLFLEAYIALFTRL